MAVTSEVCVVKRDGGIFLVFDSVAKESSVAFGTCQKFILMLCLHAYLAVCLATSVKKNRNGASCILHTIRLEMNASGPSIQRYAQVKEKTSGGDHEISLASMQSISKWALSKRTMVVIHWCVQLVILFNAIINWQIYAYT